MSEYAVNIDLANAAKSRMKTIIDKRDPRILSDFRAFSCLFELPLEGWREPVLVLKTEEPGSKQILAARYDRLEGICQDMVNHLINDCVVTGATPLTVQDAIICGYLEADVVTRLVRGIAAACQAQGCVLTGGETSEQPGVLDPGLFILTSSIVGLVEKSRIIDGSRIVPGDTVLGLESSGIHTNGYTLVRQLIDEHPGLLERTAGGRLFIDAVLEPHRCYYPLLKPLFAGESLKGLAHITGGGIAENLNRVLPQGCDAEIDLEQYVIPEIFNLLRSAGSVSDAVMLRTFNLGVGLAAVVSPEDADGVRAAAEAAGVACRAIGTIVPGSQNVRWRGALRWLNEDGEGGR